MNFANAFGINPSQKVEDGFVRIYKDCKSLIPIIGNIGSSFVDLPEKIYTYNDLTLMDLKDKVYGIKLGHKMKVTLYKNDDMTDALEIITDTPCLPELWKGRVRVIKVSKIEGFGDSLSLNINQILFFCILLLIAYVLYARMIK